MNHGLQRVIEYILHYVGIAGSGPDTPYSQSHIKFYYIEAVDIVNPGIPDPDPDHGSRITETQPRILGIAKRCRASRPKWPSVSDLLGAGNDSGSEEFL